MKTIKDLKTMIAEPASKEWFERHADRHARTKALKVKSEGGSRKIDMGHTSKNGAKYLSSKEQHEKTKKWPVMQKDFKPKDRFQELAFTHFRK